MLDIKILIVLAIMMAGMARLLLQVCRIRLSHRNLPQPPHSIFWGHLPIMGEIGKKLPPNSHFQHFVTEIAQKYDFKGLFYLDLWPLADPQVFIIDPDLMNKVTVNLALPVHKVANKFLEPYTGPDVIAAANGPAWRDVHFAIAPAFSFQQVRRLVPVFLEEATHFRTTLDQSITTKELASIQDMASDLVSNVINRVVFGRSANLTKDMVLPDLGELVELADRQFSWNPLAQIIDSVCRRFIMRRMNSVLDEVIHHRANEDISGKLDVMQEGSSDILDLLMRGRVNKAGKRMGLTSTISPKDMEVLITNTKGLLLGGSHTTRDTICYTFLLLSTHPHVADKVRQEHEWVFGTSSDAKETARDLICNPNKLGELVYTQAVIKEVLRMFPIGFNPRQASPDTSVTFEGTSYSLSSLCVVCPAHTVQYSTLHYERPSQFYPERFLDSSSPELRIGHKSAFRTFGRGSRACIGQNLALEEIKVLLLMTMRDYKFESVGLVPNKTPRVTYTDLDTVLGDVVFSEMAMDAKPRGKVMLNVKKRKQGRDP